MLLTQCACAQVSVFLHVSVHRRVKGGHNTSVSLRFNSLALLFLRLTLSDFPRGKTRPKKMPQLISHIGWRELVCSNNNIKPGLE